MFGIRNSVFCLHIHARTLTRTHTRIHARTHIHALMDRCAFIVTRPYSCWLQPDQSLPFRCVQHLPIQHNAFKERSYVLRRQMTQSAATKRIIISPHIITSFTHIIIYCHCHIPMPHTRSGQRGCHLPVHVLRSVTPPLWLQERNRGRPSDLALARALCADILRP